MPKQGRSRQQRDTALGQLNHELGKRRLSLLANPGDWSQGRREIVGVRVVHEHWAPWAFLFECDVLDTNGDPAVQTFIVYGKVGAIIIAEINNQFAFGRQWRLDGNYHTEWFRGFGDTHDLHPRPPAGLLQVVNLPAHIVLRELGEEMVQAATILGDQMVGSIPENTGLIVGKTPVFHVRLAVPEDALKRRLALPTDEAIALLLKTRAEVDEAMGARIDDAISCGAWLKFLAFQRGHRDRIGN